MRLKAGSINIFIRRAAPGTVQIPNQRISSPRGNALNTLLTGQQFQVAALFGASIDNLLDVNCDGNNDIIVGEPLSSAVGILFSGDVVGGAAHISLAEQMAHMIPPRFGLFKMWFL